MPARPPLAAALLALALLTFLAGTAPAADNLAPQNDPGGFMDLAWDTPLARVPGLWLAGRDRDLGGLDIYRREKAPETFGQARLQSVHYLFWRGRLLAVDAQTQGQADFEALRQACQERFGPGTRPNRYQENYYWLGPNSQISLRYHDVSQTSHLRLASRAILAEAQRATASQ